MRIYINHQGSYSRGELLLRTFFGILYIQIPHFFILYFLFIGGLFVNFIAFWAILFTGKYPKGMWTYMLNLQRWVLRLNASTNNLVDGYPAFGLNTQNESSGIELEYPESLSRGTLIIRLLFGFIYILIPHGICLLFLQLAAVFVRIIAWWAVLITGKYPQGLHEFMVGVIRWAVRVNLYYYNLTDTYPPFSLSETSSGSGALDDMR